MIGLISAAVVAVTGQANWTAQGQPIDLYTCTINYCTNNPIERKHLPETFHGNPQLFCDIVATASGSRYATSIEFVEGTLVCELGKPPKMDPVR